MQYCSSFFVSQRDMLDSWLRVTGQTESEWTIEYEPTQERFARGQRMLKEGNMIGGPISIYGLLFQRDGSGDLRIKPDNEKLGLSKEDLDQATKMAVKMFEDIYS